MKGGISMRVDELFEHRSVVAEQLKKCLREKGFTKVSFAKKADISRPTLDKLLNGTITSKSTFDKHIQKILDVMNMSATEMMTFSINTQPSVEVVYSKNTPVGYQMSEKAQIQYNLMLDIVDLCSIYYKGENV